MLHTIMTNELWDNQYPTVETIKFTEGKEYSFQEKMKFTKKQHLNFLGFTYYDDIIDYTEEYEENGKIIINGALTIDNHFGNSSNESIFYFDEQIFLGKLMKEPDWGLIDLNTLRIQKTINNNTIIIKYALIRLGIMSVETTLKFKSKKFIKDLLNNYDFQQNYFNNKNELN